MKRNSSKDEVMSAGFKIELNVYHSLLSLPINLRVSSSSETAGGWYEISDTGAYCAVTSRSVDGFKVRICKIKITHSDYTNSKQMLLVPLRHLQKTRILSFFFWKLANAYTHIEHYFYVKIGIKVEEISLKKSPTNYLANCLVALRIENLSPPINNFREVKRLQLEDARWGCLNESGSCSLYVNGSALSRNKHPPVLI